MAEAAPLEATTPAPAETNDANDAQQKQAEGRDELHGSLERSKVQIEAEASKGKKSSGNDFWLCIGLVLVFMIVCTIGAIIVYFVALADKNRLFESSSEAENRLETGHGAFLDNKKKMN